MNIQMNDGKSALIEAILLGNEEVGMFVCMYIIFCLIIFLYIHTHSIIFFKYIININYHLKY